MKKTIAVLLCLVLAAPLALAKGDVMKVVTLIDAGLDKNYPLIKQAAADLSSSERLMVYNMKQNQVAGPFVCNLLLGFGIGSFIQGDTAMGVVGLVGEGLGLVMLLNNSSTYYGVSTGFYIGFGLFLGTRILELVMPFMYANRYNRKLSSVLATGRASLTIRPDVMLAYVDQEWYEPAYGLRLDWRF